MKKMCKRILTAALAACLIVPAVGCADKTDDNDVSSQISSAEETGGLVEIPSFLGGTMGEAKDFLEDHDLKYTVVEEYIDSVEKFSVISQEPKAGSMVAPGSEVKLVVAMGTENAPKSSPESKAESSKAESKAESSKAERSKPESKSESSKPKSIKVDVPNLIGMQATTAQHTLDALDLYYTGNYEYSSSAPAGEVISQSPKAGTQVEERSRVTFVISNGPKPKDESRDESSREPDPELESQPEPTPSTVEAGGERYVGTYTSFRPYITIESLGDDVFYVHVVWSGSAYEGMSYELYAEYNPVSDSLEYEFGESYYYKNNNSGQMVEYSLVSDDLVGYLKLYSHNDLRWSDASVGITVDDSFTRS